MSNGFGSNRTFDVGGTNLAMNVSGLNTGSVPPRDEFLFFSSGEAVSFGQLSSSFKLDRIDDALIPREPKVVAPPVIAVAETEKTSVFESITAINGYVVNAVAGIESLRALLRNPVPSEEDRERALFAELEDYLDEYMTGSEINAVFPGRAQQVSLFFPRDRDPASGTFVRPTFRTGDDKLEELRGDNDPNNPSDGVLHTRLFEVGRIALEDSRTAQRVRHGLVRLRRARQRDLERRKRRLATLQREIVEKRRELDALNNTRLETLGDAQAAQALANENWVAVEAEYAERQRILEDNEGLYYARVRETPVTVTLPDPLALRPQIDGELVPGCSGREGEDLPDELDAFFEVILEIPMDDWAALRGRAHQLPPRRRLDSIAERRRGRMSYRAKAAQEFQVTYAAVRLSALYYQAQAAIADISSRTIARPGNLSGYQKESAKVLSLEDLVTGPRGILRRDAEQLREHLEQAVLCLQDRVQAIPAGIRLLWAEAAEDDTLAADRPELWPGLSLAGDEAFNDLRSLFELVEWWFGRLHKRAGSASVSAMKSMVRAVLMLSAGDDPHDILHGAVTVAPGRLLPGVVITLELNREATPGAILQLISPQNAVVGLVRVDDQDDSGTYASVTRVLQDDAVPDTRYTVVGKRSGKAWG